MVKPNERFERRERRVRYALRTKGGGRPRLRQHLFGDSGDAPS